jgi:hypothetical protein
VASCPASAISAIAAMLAATLANMERHAGLRLQAGETNFSIFHNAVISTSTKVMYSPNFVFFDKLLSDL